MIAITDGAGSAMVVNTYDEYGIPGATNSGRFQYTGQAWLPSVGLYHYKARAYSPTMGRFMQTDPIGYGDGMNMYEYAGSDPINFTDPTGRFIFKAIGLAKIISSLVGSAKAATTITVTAKLGAKSSVLAPLLKGTAAAAIPAAGAAAMPGKLAPSAGQGACPSGGNITVGGGLGATGFLGLGGLTGNIEGGILIPKAFFKTLSLRGFQAYASITGGVLSGLGGFFGVGPSFAGGRGTGAVKTGMTRQPFVQGGMAWGPGGEISAPITKTGFAGGGAVAGAGKYGYGAYAAGGTRISGTLALPPVGCKPL